MLAQKLLKHQGTIGKVVEEKNVKNMEWKDRKMLRGWLAFEMLVGFYISLVVIPGFYFHQTFVESKTLNQTCVMHQKNAISDASADEDQLNKAIEPCWDTKHVNLFKETTEQFSDSPVANPALGVVLVICGFCAPQGEVIGRLISNLLALFPIIAKKVPRLVHGFELLHHGTHSFLQHLTQFKLFLSGLQLLLCVKFLGVAAMKNEPGDGLKNFVWFVVWSIFINTYIEHWEEPKKVGSSFLEHMLPPKDWLPKILSAHRGKFAGTKTISNAIVLVGFYIFFTRPVFTLVYHWTPPPPLNKQGLENPLHFPGVESARYFDASFLPLSLGFEALYKFDATMYYLLAFQFLLCNLSVPVFQLIHVVVQEVAHYYTKASVGFNSKAHRIQRHQEASNKFAKSVGLLSKMKTASLVVPEAIEEGGGNAEDAGVAVPDDGKRHMTWREVLFSCIQVVMFTAVQNQAHEYFLLAFLMLGNILQGVLVGMKLNYIDGGDFGVFSMRICWNPLIFIWFLAAIPLLGRPRVKLEQELLARVPRLEESKGDDSQPSEEPAAWKQKMSSMMHNSVHNKDRFMIKPVLLVVFAAYFMVFKNDNVEKYPGIITTNFNYVGGDFVCSSVHGRLAMCVNLEGNGTTVELGMQAQKHLKLMDPDAIKNCVIGGMTKVPGAASLGMVDGDGLSDSMKNMGCLTTFNPKLKMLQDKADRAGGGAAVNKTMPEVLQVAEAVKAPIVRSTDAIHKTQQMVHGVADGIQEYHA